VPQAALALGACDPELGERPGGWPIGWRPRWRPPRRRERPGHGSFKSAQLLFKGPDEVIVTDFDQLCLADPALDVGYFLAYLRPNALWYRRTRARAWFEEAAAAFTGGYRRAMADLGVGRAEIDGALRRSGLYEAALIFKIANRRPNRLNSRGRPSWPPCWTRSIAVCPQASPSDDLCRFRIATCAAIAQGGPSSTLPHRAQVSLEWQTEEFALWSRRTGR